MKLHADEDEEKGLIRREGEGTEDKDEADNA